MADDGEPTSGAGAEEPEHLPLAIVGGGIGGLVLALCLDRAYNHPTAETASDFDGGGGGGGGSPTSNLPIHVYESTAAYTANAGGAIGLYSNGLRVLRHLSREHPDVPTLLDDVRTAGCDYLYRRWMRHDGTEVAVAREDELLPDVEVEIDSEGNVVRKETGLDRSDRSADTSGSGSSANKNRPRGDSISSQDREGERANRRPRGGSFGSLRNLKEKGGSLRNLGEMVQNLTTSKGERTSGVSTATTESSRPSLDERGSSFSSLRNLGEMVQNLAASTGERMSGASTAATESSGKTTRSSRIVETELLSLGIRRWKYQQVLYEACVAAGIHIHFGKRLTTATSVPSTGDGDEAMTLLTFKDGSQVTTSLLIGADGINSKVRNYVTDPLQKSDPSEEYVPAYTGVTCLMGCAAVPRVRGICFPSSATTKCHACYYPTRAPREGTDDDPSDYEQVFQIYFPSPVERPDTWRTLTPQEAKEECRELAKKLRDDGWDEQFLAPLESPTLTGVLRVGLRSREGLDSWHVGGNGTSGDAGENVGRAVLLGDAAHPPVPYIGQGAMMAMEDAGTLSMLLGHFCPITESNNDKGAMPDFANFAKAMEVYESLRVSRTKIILGSSVELGKTQQKRAESKLYNAWREVSIKAQVWAYGTLPVMRPGAAFDYRSAVEEALNAESQEQEEKAESG